MSTDENRLLVIGHVWPEPTATAAGQRMIHLLHFFKASGYQINFCCTSSKTAYSEDLQKTGIREVTIRLNDSGFDDYIKELQPDVVLFDRFITEEQFGWRIAETLPNCLRILNTEDLHSLRSARRKSVEKNEIFHLNHWLKADITKRELASIYRSDISLIISSYEMDVLTEKAKISKDLLFHLPLFYGKDMFTNERLPGFSDRSDFVFIGNGKHKPNIDAIKWLHEDIWGEIRKGLPDSRLNIYGAYLPDKVLQLNNPEVGFLVHGHVHNSHAMLKQSRVNLVPLRFGAGIKGKLVEAMNCGTPSAATAIGWEGIVADLIADKGNNDARSFAREAIELYRDQSKWKDQQLADKQLLKNHFDRQKYEAQLKCRISEISKDLDASRLRNHFGSILLHHTAASTKFMSRWIELKNKIK